MLLLLEGLPASRVSNMVYKGACLQVALAGILSQQGLHA